MGEVDLSNLNEAMRERLEQAGRDAMKREIEAIKAEASQAEQAKLIAELRQLQKEPTKNRERIAQIMKELKW